MRVDFDCGIEFYISGYTNLMKNYLKQQIVKYFLMFTNPVPCKECYRARMWAFIGLGGLTAFLFHPFIVCLIALIGSGIHTGRKHNWWLKNESN